MKALEWDGLLIRPAAGFPGQIAQSTGQQYHECVIEGLAYAYLVFRAVPKLALRHFLNTHF